MDAWKQKLNNGTPLLGTHITMPDIHSAELLGNCGFDYLWIDMEHTQLTKKEVCDILLASRAVKHPLATFVRIPSLDPVQVKPILEMGPTGIIFPMIRSREDVELAIASCQYPPEGIWGFGPRAAIRYGLDDLHVYIKSANRSIWKLIQIETAAAYEHLDELLTVPGVDAFIIGPCDFSGAFGHLPDFCHPDVMVKIDQVIQKVKNAGKLIGVSIGNYDGDSVELWLKKGVDLISVGNEPAFLLNGAKDALLAMQKLVLSPK